MKKALSLMLVLVLVLGMSTVAFAATIKLDPKAPLGTSAANNRVIFSAVSGTHSGTVTTTNEWTGIDALVQDGEHTYPFEIDVKYAVVKNATDGSTWNDQYGTGDMTEKQRKDSKVTIKTNVKKGSAAIDEVKFDDTGRNTAQRLTLVLKEELKNTNTDDGVEFEVTSYLVVDGAHWNNTDLDERVTWAGNLKNDLNDKVDSDYDYIYMGTGIVVEADGYIKSIECGIHNGDDDSVSVFTKMFNGKKYWAVADSDATDAQEEVMDKYGFEGVYNLRSVNLAAVADYVLLNNEDSSMYVYDGNLNYLGKGDSKLAWSDVYYLSATELEDADEDIEPDEDSDGFEDSVPGGGDDDYPDNANDNPGTGC